MKFITSIERGSILNSKNILSGSLRLNPRNLEFISDKFSEKNRNALINIGNITKKDNPVYRFSIG